MMMMICLVISLNSELALSFILCNFQQLKGLLTIPFLANELCIYLFVQQALHLKQLQEQQQQKKKKRNPQYCFAIPLCVKSWYKSPQMHT